jgi:hypothetical protein
LLHLAHDAILGPNGLVAFGHLAMARLADDDVAVGIAEPEPLISREEVVGMLFNIADIAA